MEYAKEIKTAIIPAGGFGTRFMPATKSIPKEMFPIGNKPVILHVLEEVVNSGINQVIFIVSHHKQSIESFFSPNQILEDYFTKMGKPELVEELRKICEMAEIGFVYTRPPYGNGGALLSAKHLLRKKHPFLYIWSDELMLTKSGAPRVKQCIEAWEKYRKPIVSGVLIKDSEKRSRYGMAKLMDIPGDETVKEIIEIVEKPEVGKEPSDIATHGAYILTGDVFEALENTAIGKNGELWISDVLNNMKPKTGLLTKIIKDAYYLDCGNPLEYLKSQIDYTLNFSPDAEDLKKFIKAKF